MISDTSMAGLRNRKNIRLVPEDSIISKEHSEMLELQDNIPSEVQPSEVKPLIFSQKPSKTEIYEEEENENALQAILSDTPPAGAKVTYAIGHDPLFIEDVYKKTQEIMNMKIPADQKLPKDLSESRSMVQSIVDLARSSPKLLKTFYETMPPLDRQAVETVVRHLMQNQAAGYFIHTLNVHPLAYVVGSLVINVGVAAAQDQIKLRFHDGVPAGGEDLCQSEGFRDECDPFYATDEATGKRVLDVTREMDYVYSASSNDNDVVKGEVYDDCMSKSHVQGLVSKAVNLHSDSPWTPLNVTSHCMAQGPRWGDQVPISNIKGLSDAACNEYRGIFNNAAIECQDYSEANKQVAIIYGAVFGSIAACICCVLAVGGCAALLYGGAQTCNKPSRNNRTLSV